ncbi:MAG TPA: hypothetical protein GXX75_06145 [Clostridiales bacterium]|nr:hypothetical protein [Clostridiales bacterium]
MELSMTGLNIAPITVVVLETAEASKVALEAAAGNGMSVGDGMDMGDGMNTEMGMPSAKDPLLSSWPFVIGISAAVLLVSVALGILLAKRKIKKGIELYED